MQHNLSSAQLIGNLAESKVMDCLQSLSAPWQSFGSVEWRLLQQQGEQIGEADAVVFHPQHGLIVFEIKAGAVSVKDGQWFYASGHRMSQSPCQQARRNRYALIDKLTAKIGKDAARTLSITHAVFFPDVLWKHDIPAELPSRSFLLDRQSLNNIESALLQIFKEASSCNQAWTKAQQQAIQQIFAPSVVTFSPLVVQVEHNSQALHRATMQQMNVLRMLASQNRLLVDGIAGSGKTHLAMTLAEQHARQGRQVLLTCYNRYLAAQLAQATAHIPNIKAIAFHDLVREYAEQAGLGYTEPRNSADFAYFYGEGTTELLLHAIDSVTTRFDSIIVDEAADFKSEWWIALEALGTEGFSWYCFFDLQQNIYLDEQIWQPPFAANVMSLTENLRNTQPIGLVATRYGKSKPAERYLVEHGIEPAWYYFDNFDGMALQLRQLLKQLTEKELIPAENIVVLAPFRHSNKQSTWSAGLNQVPINTDMAQIIPKQIRVGTLQGFKGLEADVVILAGLNATAAQHPTWFYVGATRAKAALYILALKDGWLEAS